MDAPTAALIGAAFGSAASVAGHFVAHELSARRDRRNEHRRRLHQVITEAATALYVPGEPMADPGRANLSRNTDAALLDHDGYSLTTNHWNAIVLLTIHLGHDHRLVDSFQSVMVTGAAFESANAKIPWETAPAYLQTHPIYDNWITAARAEVDRIK
jgi:hypothetical protein